MINKNCETSNKVSYIIGSLDNNDLYRQYLGFSEQNFSRYFLSLLEAGTINIQTFLPDVFQGCTIEFVAGVTEFQRKDIVVHFKVNNGEGCELDKGDHILIIENKVFSIVDNTQIERYCAEYNNINNNKKKELNKLFSIKPKVTSTIHFTVLAPIFYNQTSNSNCKWHQVTYKQLPNSIDSIFKKLIQSIYSIIELTGDNKQAQFLNQNYCDTWKRVSNNISQLEKHKYGLDSFYKKHLAARMAYALFDKLKNANTFNGLVITNNWQREHPTMISGKYVICHGFSNGEGLVEVIYFHSVQQDDKGKVKNPKALIIQVQGNDYRTGIISKGMVNYTPYKTNPTYNKCELFHNQSIWFFGNKNHAKNIQYYTFGDMYFTKKTICGNNTEDEKKSSTPKSDSSISELFDQIIKHIENIKDVAQCIFNDKKCP